MGDKPVPNRYDPYQLKAKVDEVMVTSLTKTHKLSFNQRYSNYKLLLGFIATCFCVFAHVYEYFFVPFPKDYVVLCVCVAGYFLFNFAYQYVDYWVAGDIFFSTKPVKPTLNKYEEVSFSSTMPRFSEFYELTLFTKLKGSSKFDSKKISTSVAELFTEEGRLLNDRVATLADDALRQLSQNK
mmetsp:Transcript_32946/g.57751  ORF Transcript_32946/g.57751 Transcript_32946/m.57751 type:complete len:183 (-) Transcript_32946:2944-3492(-)